MVADLLWLSNTFQIQENQSCFLVNTFIHYRQQKSNMLSWLARRGNFSDSAVQQFMGQWDRRQLPSDTIALSCFCIVCRGSAMISCFSASYLHSHSYHYKTDHFPVPTLFHHVAAMLTKMPTTLSQQMLAAWLSCSSPQLLRQTGSYSEQKQQRTKN